MLTGAFIPLFFGGASKAQAQAPAAPTGLTGIPGNTHVDLYWGTVAGATGYNLKKGTSISGPFTNVNGSPLSTPSLASTGLTNGTPYFYEATALNASGESLPSAVTSLTPNTAPAVPTFATLSATTGQCTLTWAAVSGGTFNVYRSTSTGTQGIVPIATGLTGTSYNDTSIVNGTKYYYKVAVVVSGEESVQSNERSVTPLAAPTSLSAVPGNNAITLNWAPVAGAEAYRIYRGTSSGSETLLGSPVYGPSFTDTSAVNSTSYYYKVTAYIASPVSESVKSTEISAQPLASLPSLVTLSAAPLSSTAVALTWTAASGASTYKVLRSTSSGGPYSVLSTVSTTAYSDIPPVSASTYYYVVQTVTGSAVGPNSNEVAISASNGISLADIGDSYSQQDHPTTNVGLTLPLSVQETSGAERVVYIKFDLSAVSGTITSALLSLYKYGGVSNPVTIYGISPAGWTETGITYSNAPSLSGATIAASGTAGTANQYYTFDVTSYLQAQKTAGASSVALAVTTTGTSATNFNSRENAANIPQLVVTTSPSTISSALTATPGEKQVLLTWAPVAGATGYNVYYPITGGYTKVSPSTPIAANAFINTGLTNGTTYNYVVTAIVGGVEGTYSAQASATPLAQDTYWTFTAPSGGTTPAATINGIGTAFSSSTGSQLIASATVAGTTSSNVSVQRQASCSGTWTFTWSGSTWPTLYIVNEIQKQLYSASVNVGTGGASVKNTGGSILVSAANPVTGTQILTVPATTNSFNTSWPANPIISALTAMHIAGNQPAPGSTSSTMTGWTDMSYSLNLVNKAYTTAWFQANFPNFPTTPIVLTFQAIAPDITAAANLSSSTSTGSASANATINDLFSGS